MLQYLLNLQKIYAVTILTYRLSKSNSFLFSVLFFRRLYASIFYYSTIDSIFFFFFFFFLKRKYSYRSVKERIEFSLELSYITRSVGWPQMSFTSWLKHVSERRLETTLYRVALWTTKGTIWGLRTEKLVIDYVVINNTCTFYGGNRLFPKPFNYYIPVPPLAHDSTCRLLTFYYDKSFEKSLFCPQNRKIFI